ncbi:ATP-dependent sacrificial sulfur transferase LarE (plasmid) [Streptomyces sp. NBC_01450]|uniref:ATP-dependent sacrificial sulfur transferase LarE n=1 Tax=Streptomyces sp. NBC_01450 TaxID=2903871 RepID=UPI002E2F1731|nr:ATP-dependent sacrificial sulfur transferase LarE [Streptomyces sp. NBC_01450]
MPTPLPSTLPTADPAALTALAAAPRPALAAEDAELASRLDDLHARLAGLDSLLVAFSGGADSTLVVAAAARALGPGRVLAATGDSASLSERERGAVRAIAQDLGVRHAFVTTHELERTGYRRNARSRCWFCKTELLDRLRTFATGEGIGQIATGTNADDLLDPFRPGIKAAAAQGALTPLADAGLTKAQVRAASSRWGLATWSKPASPCLSSRIAYGLTITRERLSRVEQAEEALRNALRNAGITSGDLRVRDLGDRALIQVDRPAVPAVLGCDPALDAVRAAGFGQVEVDPLGFRSGSLNTMAVGRPREDGNGR